MDDRLKKATIKYLESVIACDPAIDPQKMGECIYCGAALDEAKPHKENCHYLEAKRLLAEFKDLGEEWHTWFDKGI